MDKPPSVSVVIPTYNHGEFLKESIGSVIRQTFSDWEAIIVNNFSKDNTIEVVNSFGDPRIHLVNYQNNDIIAASRNEGIRVAKGEYIAFLDSDDIWLSDKLERQVELLESSEEIALIYTRFKTIENGLISNKTYPKTGRYSNGSIFKSLYLKHFIACSSVMVRKNILNEIGMFDTAHDLISAEDTDLWLRIALKHVIKCTDISPLLLYRVYPGSISHSPMGRMRKSLIIAKRYKKNAGNFMFLISSVLNLAHNFKESVKMIRKAAKRNE